MALTDENGGIGATMLVGPTGYGAAPYPVYQGNNGFGGSFGGDWGWIILLLLLAGGGWGMGGFGGGFGGGLGYDFPWLLNGQNGINNNVSSGFRDAQLHDSITSVRDGITGLSTQLCNCCHDMTVSNMQTAYAGQTAMLQGFNGLQNQLAQCCCDNRAATQDLKYTVATEACADRAAVSDALRDVIAANTASTQKILDQLCADKIDAKNDQIAQLRQELLFARGQASQDVQTAALRQSDATTANQLIAELRSCPIPAMPVYGQTPIFTCNNGCGCGGNVGGFNGNF